MFHRREAVRLTPAVASGLYLGIIAILAALYTPQELVRLFPDDAFFYLKTAQHLAAGAGSTFDGVNPTDGYHPLYLWLLTLLGQSVYTVLFLDTFLTIVWFYAADAVARALGFGWERRSVLLAGLLLLAANPDFGMENNLLLPLAWLFVAGALTTAPAWLLGLLAVAIVAARLDAVAFVGLVGLAWLIQTRPTWRDAAALAMPVSLAVAAFVAYNLWTTGHPSTVSSWLKFNPRGELHLGWSPQQAGLVGSVLVGLVALVRRRSLILAGVGAWIIVTVVLMLGFLRGGPERWYFPLPISFGLLIALTLAHDRLSAWFVRGAVVGCLALSALWLRGQLGRWWRFDDGVKMGRWIAEQLPREARVYQVDNAGIVAYYADRAVINGDGLINSWAYQDALRSGRLRDYLVAHNVEYYVFDEYKDEPTVQILVPLWNAPPVTLSLASGTRLARFGRFALFRADPRTVEIGR